MVDGKQYRVAVIGRTGKGDYGHGLDMVWVNHPRAELVAVADENEAGRTAAAKRLGVQATYADYRKMLATERPQIVSVAPRWLDAHRDMVIACAEHGASIFLEKPVAPTLLEADEMVAACDKAHVKCAVAHQTRYSRRVKKVRELISSGRVGDVVEMNGHGKCDRRGGGEDMMVLGTHTFDLMRYLIGEPRWCFARVQVDGRKATPGDVRQLPEGIGPGLGDHITATYGFSSPAVGHFTTFRAKDGANARYWLEVRGTKGIIHVGFGAIPAAYLCEDPTWMPGKSKSPWLEISSAGVGEPEPLKANAVGNGNRWIVDDLIASIEQDRPPHGSLVDGRAALEMILAVYESHRLDRLVNIPLRNRKHPLTLV
jgi:predicted dehydrogenase